MATAPAAVSANKAELLAIADAVAREKLIDKGIVIEAMEDAIQRAATGSIFRERSVESRVKPSCSGARTASPTNSPLPTSRRPSCS